METMSGDPFVWGLSMEVFLMMLSGVFYLMCAYFLWKPFRQEKNELMGALFAFLVYQAVSMFFMGIEMHTMNLMYGNIATLAVFIGSVYMLKFPLSYLSERVRRIWFRVFLIAVLSLFVWFIQTPERQMAMMHFTLWYDIIVNGIVVGGFILFIGLRAVGRFLKIKAIGGGTGVISCCVVANAAMLGGAFLTSAVFQFLAPVVILWSLAFARRKQKELQSTTTV